MICRFQPRCFVSIFFGVTWMFGAVAQAQTATSAGLPHSGVPTTSAMKTPAKIRFSNSCEGVSQVTIGAVGDFLMHDPLQKKAARQGTFINQWRAFLPYTRSADIMYGNLETTTARGLTINGQLRTDPGLVYDRSVHTSFPLFNVHPQLLTDMKNSGFDVVSTSNNHSLDRGTRGVDLTIEELEKVDLAFTGTRKRGEFRDWHTIVRAGDFTTAWVACTWVLNIADRERQVFHCERDERELMQLIRDLRSKVDAVIVTPHWGEEYQNRPQPYQVRAGKEYLEAGAAMVLGAHPHALQPIERHVTRDGRETVIAYSLANFISFQPRLISKTTVMLFIGLSKNARGETFINGVRFIPAFMRNRTGDFMDVELLPIVEGKPHGQEGLAHILSLFPAENQLRYGDPLVTNPECLRPLR